jgi:hypothetical protein
MSGIENTSIRKATMQPPGSFVRPGVAIILDQP